MGKSTRRVINGVDDVLLSALHQEIQDRIRLYRDKIAPKIVAAGRRTT